MGRYNANSGSYEPAGEIEIYQNLLDKYNEILGEGFSLESWAGTQDGNNYLIVAQEILNLENDIAKLAERTADFIRLNKLLITIPITTASDVLQALEGGGYNASLRPLTQESEAGKAYIVAEKDGVDLASDASERNKLAQLINNHVAEGILTIGNLSGQVTLSNGQIKDIFFELPVEKPLYLRATVLYSATNPEPFQDETAIKSLIATNFNKIYKIGNIVSPDKYLKISEIPFANSLKMEYSDDGTTWSGGVTDNQPEDYTCKRILADDNIIVILQQV